MNFKIETIGKEQNCYIVYDKTGEGVVIDPGTRGEVIFDKIKELSIRVKYILLTHCHYDHITGLRVLRKLTGADVVGSFECNLGIQKAGVNLSNIFADPFEEEPVDLIINDGDIIKAGNMEIEVITTPGHTKGGVCFLIDNDLFSGDTLFARSIGRTDLPGSDTAVLIKSIKERLYILDDDTIVHPGHGNDTKIDYEKRYNMFVKA